jgi:Holliday junction resolvase RusA-like endonuclease
VNISVFVAGDPKAQPRPKAFAFRGHARVYDPGTAEGWKGAIALALRPWVGEVVFPGGAVVVSLGFVFRRPKSHYRSDGSTFTKGAPSHHTGAPDTDNLAKAVLDACTSLGLWRDDSQVIDLRVRKAYALPGAQPGVQVLITADLAAPLVATTATLPLDADPPPDEATR